MFAFLQVADPIEQFEIKKVFSIENVLGYDLSFTNSSAYMVLGTIMVIVLFGYAATRTALVPSRIQSIGELGYEFVADMVRSTTGEEGLKFFPFVFTLFTFILVANLIGMVPYAFTSTSHLVITGALAILVIAVVIIFGFIKNGLGFFRLFLPSGVPILIAPLLILIEVISFMARPITLGMRLFANMLAGHIMLKLLAAFAVSLAGAGYFALISPAPFVLAIAITALEFLVSFIQAYVFALLTCVYLNDALHPGH